MHIDLDARIPNNVGLGDDPKLQRALEEWQPAFLDWWRDMGPDGFQLDDVYLRTAIDVDPRGWAQFDYVKMPDYRWGVFLAAPEQSVIGFGDHIGEPVWDKVPGDHRTALRRIIVTQGDTEPASVEQQRQLGKCAPSLYDLRNLFQVNVEEGRHLWAMVYLLHKYFGRDGREEAEDLLTRRSGNPDTPRILGAFNEPISDWLSFFCFTMFTDRDGKYQLAALAESAFDPLARSTRFMLTEEAHHMFVGETGIQRIIERTVEQMVAGKDPRDVGAIPLDVIQRYINRWVSVSMDLFGGEDSSNAATYFASGLKGRFNEGREGKYRDHVALEGSYTVERPGENGAILREDIPLRRAMNLLLRDEYFIDGGKGLQRWNKIVERAGFEFRFTMPSERFNRKQGIWADQPFSPGGEWVGHEAFAQRREAWLPSRADEQYVQSLMVPVYERGKIAPWIAPPRVGINNNGFDFEYVKFDQDPYERI
jgi:benzoyl-CoA 2,3-dioxygenase component B